MEKILVIEDDFAIRNSVEFALRRRGYEVRSLDSGGQALGVLREFAPDLVVLDIMLPGKSGHEIAEELRRTDATTAIIMVSALSEERDRIYGLQLGADDYVTKPFSLEELLARVEANLRRVGSGVSAASSGKPLVFGRLRIDPRTREVRVGARELELRAKEFALLWALASHAGEVLTRSDLAEQVWGQPWLSSSRTIDVHIRRLRALLSGDEAGGHEYIRTSHGVGYKFVAADSGAHTAADADDRH